MAEYQLTKPAQQDLEEIYRYLYLKASPETAARVEERLFLAFEELVRLPAIGHRRFDVKQEDYRFHLVFDYVIAFRREPRVIIVRVIHGAQNIARIF